MNQERNASGTIGRETSEQSDKGRSIAEWTTLCISIAILISIVGLITYLDIGGNQDGPRIVVEVNFEHLREESSGYYLPVVVTNEGDLTAEDAIIEAELDSASGEPERAELTVTFLAGGERVRGTFVFEDDPSEGELTVHATSYREP